ncbi:copper chaperone, partial [Ophidiomyces ophidiicola]
MLESFQATFAVPLTCESCVEDISKPLYEIKGVNKVEADLKNQLVLVEGTAAPSAIVTAIQDTGRDAVLRGSGSSNNASVCILETHARVPVPIRGLARMVQISTQRTLVDLTINGLAPGTYWATVRAAGDVSRGAASTGGIWGAGSSPAAVAGSPDNGRGVFGQVVVDARGKGNVFLDRPVAVWELIGRSMVVSRDRSGPFKADDPNTIVGVIARSAGVWDNDKMVCSCSGKNVWQEREEQLARGM